MQRTSSMRWSSCAGCLSRADPVRNSVQNLGCRGPTAGCVCSRGAMRSAAHSLRRSFETAVVLARLGAQVRINPRETSFVRDSGRLVK